MTQEEKILVDKYLDYKKAEKEAKRNSVKILKELEAFAPHKVGEIVKWTEYKKKNLGSIFHPNFVDLPPVEKKAVVARIEVNVWDWEDDDVKLTYLYEFRPFKKNGDVSLNQCYPNRDSIEWTGEVYSLNKE